MSRQAVHDHGGVAPVRQGDEPVQRAVPPKDEGVVGKRRWGKVLEDVPDPEHLQGQLLPSPTEKRPHPLIGRAEQQVAERAALDDPAAIDQDDLLRQPPRLGDVVRDDDDRFAELGVQAKEIHPESFRDAGVEHRKAHPSEGCRGRRPAPGDADPLPLAAR